MSCAKKPLPQKGAYFLVRDRIAERGFDAVIRPTLNKFAERRHLDEERESTPAIGVPTKRRNRRARFVGKRSNRAQAKGKPLFRVAFLQFSADCDVGAYYVVRNEPKEGC